ncbi:beta-1,4-mannosyl-glycoprotein 4-beta-N-acetylglucosaminyltransferase, partial [Arapaima gigas]
RMKMRRHRLFLLCTVALCVVSFLHYYKALHYVSLLRELSAPYPNIKSFIVVSDFFWRDQSFPQANALPHGTEVQPAKVMEKQPNVNPKLWNPSKPSYDKLDMQKDSLAFVPPDPYTGDLHLRSIQLHDDQTSYFVRTKSGALCFRQGTETAVTRENPHRRGRTMANQRKTLQHKEPFSTQFEPKRGKRLVKCVCRQGWHGPYCGVPTTVYHSNLPTKERLTPREVPRRIINAVNINHEFDLLHVRFQELVQAVDLFIICESNFTAYGEERALNFLRLLLKGTYDYVRHKILYVFLDHFPEGGRQDGWIADDYLRTFLTRNGMSRVKGLRPDDVFIINDADEIPAWEGVLFLKLFDGWTEPFAIHMRKSLYGFFWKQPGSLEVISGCTVGMLNVVYNCDGIMLRRREYYNMAGFRKYENATGHILVQWSIGSPVHLAGWHCSWCFPPEGIYYKLISAQNGDFPRWGDYEDKRDLNYIRELIRTGGWFDGTVQQYPPSDPKEPMYAPKYLLENYERYRYMLENPYAGKRKWKER